MMFILLVVMYTRSELILSPAFAYVYMQSPEREVDFFRTVEPPSDSCIPSGDHSSIQNALTADGSKAVLCPDAVFELSESIYFTHDNQEIYTRGFPTDSTRAFLKIVHQDVATAVFAGNNSNVRLSNVIIDGNRPELGIASGALMEFGSTGTGNTVEWVRAYEPRGWSVLYLGEGDDRLCSGAIARYNELGPAGYAEYGLADGISLACRNSIVENNTIVDVTDGGIVIFQAPGSNVANNTIRAENRIMFYGISMEDYGPYDGDFTGTQVTGNIIDASGAMIRRGIGMGPHVGCIPIDEATLRSRGAVITNNTLMGDHMAYGFVASGVRDWIVTGNVDLSTHPVPEKEIDCFGEWVDPPGGFMLNPMTTSGTFQEEFEAAVLGFTVTLWPFQPVVSESCVSDLIGEVLLEEIKSGSMGPVWEALENAPNGERIGECVSIYERPDISDLSGHVMVQLLPCEPFCVELKLTNIDETDTVSLERTQFILENFPVGCPGLPTSLAPGEEADCIIDDYVAPGFQVLMWYGFPPDAEGIGFWYPFGTGVDTLEDMGSPLVKSFSLSQNHPNPFNPSTTIDYTVSGDEAVRILLNIYDLRGGIVRTLVDAVREPGRFTVYWDGKDNNGNDVDSGIYLYRIEAGDYTSTRKMTILR